MAIDPSGNRMVKHSGRIHKLESASGSRRGATMLEHHNFLCTVIFQNETSADAVVSMNAPHLFYTMCDAGTESDMSTTLTSFFN